METKNRSWKKKIFVQISKQFRAYLYRKKFGVFLSQKEFKNQKKKAQVVKEFIETEETFNEKLRFCSCNIIRGLRKEKIIKKSEIEEGFSNLEEIYELSGKLLSEFRKCSFPCMRISECLQVIPSFFKVYMKYIENYENSNKILSELLKNEEKFRKFVKEKEMTKSRRGYRLRDYLCLPLGRLPRYGLMIERLGNSTHASNGEKEVFLRILKQFREMNDKIFHQRFKRSQEKRIKEISEFVRDELTLNKLKDRKLVDDSVCRLFYSENTDDLFLLFKIFRFDDVIFFVEVISNPAEGVEYRHFYIPIMYSTVKIVELQDEELLEILYVREGIEKKLYVLFDDYDELDKWQERLEESVEIHSM